MALTYKHGTFFTDKLRLDLNKWSEKIDQIDLTFNYGFKSSRVNCFLTGEFRLFGRSCV